MCTSFRVKTRANHIQAALGLFYHLQPYFWVLAQSRGRMYRTSAQLMICWLHAVKFIIQPMNTFFTMRQVSSWSITLKTRGSSLAGWTRHLWLSSPTTSEPSKAPSWPRGYLLASTCHMVSRWVCHNLSMVSRQFCQYLSHDLQVIISLSVTWSTCPLIKACQDGLHVSLS